MKNHVIFGFSSKGEYLIPTIVESESDFIERFGTPSTESEKHLYMSVKESINGNHKTYVVRIQDVNDINEKARALMVKYSLIENENQPDFKTFLSSGTIVHSSMYGEEFPNQKGFSS